MDEKYIVNAYNCLKDNLEDEDDFDKMYHLFEKLAEDDPMKAFDMWYFLLDKYESYITKCCVNETYYFINQNLDLFGKRLGYRKFDEMILSDNYLYNLLFKQYCYAGSHYNYIQKMIERAMEAKKYDLSERMLSDVFSNPNKEESWFEIMDGFMHDITYEDFAPNDEALEMLSKWSAKIAGKKERAKIMSSMMATGLGFDLSVFDNEESKPQYKNYKQGNSLASETLKKLLTDNPSALFERKVLKGLLSDYYPQNKLYVNTLLMAYDEGIVNELSSSQEVDDFRKMRMQTMLINNYGISQEMAESVVSTWEKALK